MIRCIKINTCGIISQAQGHVNPYCGKYTKGRAGNISIISNLPASAKLRKFVLYPNGLKLLWGGFLPFSYLP
jgi:hypothetical protein